MTAILFTMENSPYRKHADVDLWGIERDARNYSGPSPVVAHPPCERWGRYWHGGPSARVRRVKGDDADCFLSALSSVLQFGGVIEHPAASAAWSHFGINKPPRTGGWVPAGPLGGWTCCVDQGHYGHRAQKATWLYTTGPFLPELTWGKSEGKVRLNVGYYSAEERRRAIKTGGCQVLSKRQRTETPAPFRHLLIHIAKNSIGRSSH